MITEWAVFLIPKAFPGDESISIATNPSPSSLSQGLEAFRRHAPVRGEAEPEHARAVGDAFLDPGEVVVADAERGAVQRARRGTAPPAD